MPGLHLPSARGDVTWSAMDSVEFSIKVADDVYSVRCKPEVTDLAVAIETVLAQRLEGRLPETAAVYLLDNLLRLNLALDKGKPKAG